MEPTATKNLQQLRELVDTHHEDFERLEKLSILANAPLNFRMTYADMLIDSGDSKDAGHVRELLTQAMALAPADQRESVKKQIDHLNEEENKKEQK